MKNLLLILVICFLACSLTAGESDPLVKKFDNQTYFCFTRTQMETLAVKLENAVMDKEMVTAQDSLIMDLRADLQSKQAVIEIMTVLDSVKQEQIDDYENFWNRPDINRGIGAFVMWMAVWGGRSTP